MTTANKINIDMIVIKLTERGAMTRSLTIDFLGMNDVWKFCSILILYYRTYCNLRNAKPSATANSGPTASRTLPKKEGAPTLLNG